MSNLIELKDATATTNSTATIKLISNEEFLGSTGEGSFPPVGKRYSRFTFAPKRGEGGIMAFYCEGIELISLHQYYWKNDKLIVVCNKVNRPTRQFSDSEEFGFSVQIGDWCYVTKAPAGSDVDYKVVGLLELLSYVDGKIDQEDLESCSESFMQHAKKVVHTEELEKTIKHLREHSESLGREIHECTLMCASYQKYQKATRNFVETFSWVPRWMLPKTMKDLFGCIE